jgi:hypothetical protein
MSRICYDEGAQAEEEGRRLFSEEGSAGHKKQNRPIAGKEGGTEMILMRLLEQSSEVVSVFIGEGKSFIFSLSRKHL